MRGKKIGFIGIIIIIVFTFILVSCGTKVKETSSYSNGEEGVVDTYIEDILQGESDLKKEYAKNQKVAFLTFDDGPSKNTEKILNILKREKVKATFFVNGYEGDFAKDMYKRIVEEGHAIGNHTYSHSYKGVYKSQDSFINDMEKLERYIISITGVKPNIVRFPGGSNNTINRKYSGSINNEFMVGLANRIENDGYTYFDWTVDSTDASKMRQSVEKITSSTLSESLKQKYPVILFHDAPAKTTTVEALPTIIKGLRKNGYLLDKLSKDTPINSRFLNGEYGEILK